MPTKTTTLTLRLGPNLREELEERARDSEMALGEFVRHAVTTYLRQRPTEAQIRAEAEAFKEEILSRD